VFESSSINMMVFLPKETGWGVCRCVCNDIVLE
jgi:hypothetical protein